MIHKANIYLFFCFQSHPYIWHARCLWALGLGPIRVLLGRSALSSNLCWSVLLRSRFLHSLLSVTLTPQFPFIFIPLSWLEWCFREKRKKSILLNNFIHLLKSHTIIIMFYLIGWLNFKEFYTNISLGNRITTLLGFSHIFFI